MNKKSEDLIRDYACKITTAYRSFRHNRNYIYAKVIFYFGCLVEKVYDASIDEGNLSALKKDLNSALKNIPIPLSKVEQNDVNKIIKKINKSNLF